MSRCYVLVDQIYISNIRQSSGNFQILNIKTESSKEEIRKAYKFLSKKVHPDKNKAPGATKAFRKLYNAYYCLMNENDDMVHTVIKLAIKHNNKDFEDELLSMTPKVILQKFITWILYVTVVSIISTLAEKLIHVLTK